MNIQVILGQMTVLFAMMFIGYFLWKKEWFNDYAYQQLSKIVVNIFNPILVINGVLGKSSAGNTNLLLQNLILSTVFFIFLMIMGVVIVWIIRPDIKDRNMYKLMTATPNVGFMGIPVITSVFGNKSMIYIVFYILISNVLIYTYGFALMKNSVPENKKSSGKSAVKGQLKQIFNAGVIASIVAVIIFFMQINMPSPVMNFCNYMGNATIPLSMLLIGMSIAKSNLKKIFTNMKAYAFSALRMVIIPVAVVLACKHLPLDATVFGVFALQMAMPVGNIVALIAKDNGVDETCCTNVIVLSTLLSIVTIPIVYMCLA